MKMVPRTETRKRKGYQNRDGLAQKLLAPEDKLVIFIVSFMYF
jgi:hypothetical protein